MVTPFIKSLVGAGLKELGETLFEGVVDKGKDVLTDKIKDVTGLEIDFDKPATAEEIDIFQKKADELAGTIEGMKELNRHDEAMALAEVELAEKELEDIQDARKHDTTIQTSENVIWLAKYTPHVIDLTVVFTFIALIFTLFFLEVPGDNKDMLYIVVGVLVREVGTIIHFYKGTSKSSSDKNSTIDMVLKDQMETARTNGKAFESDSDAGLF